MIKKATLIFICLFVSGVILAQQPFALDPVLYHVFDRDSLKGFDEDAARRSAITEHFTGPEFPVRMYQLKRSYINDKYSLWPKVAKHSHPPVNVPNSNKGAAVPGCVNEDFEQDIATATITSLNQINGWTISQGINQGGQINSCNLAGCCPNTPSESAIFVAPNGYIDPVIGSCYPIYSVFGSNPGDPNGNAVNPQITFPMKGNNFIRINSANNNKSIEKLSKTFMVTNQNALFQFAFISVFSTGHGCCDAGAFQIKLPGFACPNFSASALSTECTNTATTIEYLKVQNCLPATAQSGGNIFNRWQVSSMDLTQYIGQNITIEIVATDCTAGGHYGYVYFDAQCGPMTIYGNGTAYPATTTSVVVPTCGAAGATMCASAGLGPYAWAGLNVPPNYAAYSNTNICFTSTNSATYTLYMNPPGSCAPITRLVTSTITPAPNLVISAVQAVCGNTLASVSVTPGGSAGNPAFLLWGPTPLTLNQSSTGATYQIPLTSPIVVSVTASDPIGCLITSTINVMPAAPIPTFAIQNNTGQYLITCRTPSVDLTAVSGYTYGGINYFWAGNSFTSTATNVVINFSNTSGPNSTFTVTGMDPVSLCASTKTISIAVNMQIPTSMISPTFQSLTCSVTSVADITLTAVNPSVNITHNISSPLGGVFTSQSYSLIYQASGTGTAGVYQYCLVNEANGCKSCKSFTITSNGGGFPVFDLVSSPGGFTLGCNSKSVTTINIANAQTTPAGGSLTYTLLTPSSTNATPPGSLSNQSTYNVNTPGTYTAIAKDPFFCETRIPFSVLSNTFGPSIDSVLVPRNVLDCSGPQVLLRGVSLAPNVSYQWGFPGTPGTLQSDSITVVVNTITIPTPTIVANYTLTITDNNNTCISVSVVPIYQNLFKPKAGLSNGGVSALSCKVPTLMLTNVSLSSIPGNNAVFPPPFLPVVGYIWMGPSPQVSLTNQSSYMGQIPGNYTLIVKDMNNGCTSETVITIADDMIYPTVNNPDAPKPSVLDCGAKSASLTPIVTSATTNLIYEWTFPVTAVTNQSTIPGPKTLSTTVPGEYHVIVTNTLNGCASGADMSVIDGTLAASFEMEKTSDYAPVTVSFSNTSSSTLGSASITSVWTFGNGRDTTIKPTNITFSPKAVYKQAGTYTITMYAAKGNCLKTIQKVIQVEVPSELIIPNVFTPNKDGVNDVFFLKTSNLTEIKMSFFDRWGKKIYESNSDTGNISWDGKSGDKEVAEGTYYYILKATGKDGKSYEKKGTVSLYR